MTQPGLAFDNSYARDLADCCVAWSAEAVPAPRLLAWNSALARDLGLGPQIAGEAAAYFSGNLMLPGAQPVAQVYAGHQFGGFSPRLGDGRALLLGEVVAPDGRRFDLQLKGAGRTPFSRGGDGRSALGPVLREYLVCEAMHALGVPTTRALAAVSTGAYVFRERALPGGILTRVAASHIRVGTFQYFAAQGEIGQVRRLADHVIGRHYPAARAAQNPYLALFRAVVAAQAALVARWMCLGFVHGVMNTDNTTVSGETIDYGPCAFLDRYDPRAVFSSIDEMGRYAYGNQPVVMQWNLARFAETLIDLVDSDTNRAVGLLTEALGAFEAVYDGHRLAIMRGKLGLDRAKEGDRDLIEALLDVMAQGEVDFTRGMRSLSGLVRGDIAMAEDVFASAPGFGAWRARYEQRIARETAEPADRAARMDRVNPLYIPRNHHVEEVLAAAVEHGDMAPFERLAGVLADSFTEQPGREAYALPAPGHDRCYRTFCGT